MRHINYRNLIDRGRKAGLGTADLYNAIASRPLDHGGRSVGEADSNGYVHGYDRGGHSVYRPTGSSYRS